MTLGEKVLTIKSRVQKFVYDEFGECGIDPALGSLILDAIKSDLFDISYKAHLENEAAPQVLEQEQEQEQEQEWEPESEHESENESHD